MTDVGDDGDGWRPWDGGMREEMRERGEVIPHCKRLKSRTPSSTPVFSIPLFLSLLFCPEKHGSSVSAMEENGEERAKSHILSLLTLSDKHPSAADQDLLLRGH